MLINGIRLDSMVSGGNGGESSSNASGGLKIQSQVEQQACCVSWNIPSWSKIKQKSLWSKYFEVGGYDCRLLVYPQGDTQALPGYLSVYLQLTDPRQSGRWDCFASYRLQVQNQKDSMKSLVRDSWHRFSVKKKSHGWCDFALVQSIMDPKAGFIVDDNLLITAEIIILKESAVLNKDNEQETHGKQMSQVLSGRFTWKVYNFRQFQQVLQTQKIMSPAFPAGDCNLRLSVYISFVNDNEYLSMCLESKDQDKAQDEKTTWCVFRLQLHSSKGGQQGAHIFRDSSGRLSNTSGKDTSDNTSLGWNDYILLSDFLNPQNGYFTDDVLTVAVNYNAIKEYTSFMNKIDNKAIGKKKSQAVDPYSGKFVWKIENFNKLKDLLKKRKLTGLCIKSNKFMVGGKDCRLIVYPRGQSSPPMYLSMFLEVGEAKNDSDWSSFVSHKLSVINQKSEADKSVSKESQNRYSRHAKDWGWREFLPLQSLFDQDLGFIVNDTVVFQAEVLILKEHVEIKQGCAGKSGHHATSHDTCASESETVFVWRIDNFVQFKEILETRKVFSQFFQTNGCDLRIGVYESFGQLCMYLETDQNTDKNYWVKYRISMTNHRNHRDTRWKDTSLCTRTWNSSVLQFIKTSDVLNTDLGFINRDSVELVCKIIDLCPWFEFGDPTFYMDDEDDLVSTEPAGDYFDSGSELSQDLSSVDGHVFNQILEHFGFMTGLSDQCPSTPFNPDSLQQSLQTSLLKDPQALGVFMSGLKSLLMDPSKAQHLLVPTIGSSGPLPANPSLVSLLFGIPALQQPLMDVLLECMASHLAQARAKGDVDSLPSQPGVQYAPQPPMLHLPHPQPPSTTPILGASNSTVPAEPGVLPPSTSYPQVVPYTVPHTFHPSTMYAQAVTPTQSTVLVTPASPQSAPQSSNSAQTAEASRMSHPTFASSQTTGAVPQRPDGASIKVSDGAGYYVPAVQPVQYASTPPSALHYSVPYSGTQALGAAYEAATELLLRNSSADSAAQLSGAEVDRHAVVAPYGAYTYVDPCAPLLDIHTKGTDPIFSQQTQQQPTPPHVFPSTVDPTRLGCYTSAGEAGGGCGGGPSCGVPFTGAVQVPAMAVDGAGGQKQAASSVLTVGAESWRWVDGCKQQQLSQTSEASASMRGTSSQVGGVVESGGEVGANGVPRFIDTSKERHVGPNGYAQSGEGEYAGHRGGKAVEGTGAQSSSSQSKSRDGQNPENDISSRVAETELVAAQMGHTLRMSGLSQLQQMQSQQSVMLLLSFQKFQEQMERVGGRYSPEMEVALLLILSIKHAAFGTPNQMSSTPPYEPVKPQTTPTRKQSSNNTDASNSADQKTHAQGGTARADHVSSTPKCDTPLSQSHAPPTCSVRVTCPSNTIQARLLSILTTAPQFLQAELIALLPSLVSDTRQSQVAQLLVRHLTQPFDARATEPQLRLVLLRVLSMLRMEPDVQREAFDVALCQTDAMTDIELPFAVCLLVHLAGTERGQQVKLVEQLRRRGRRGCGPRGSVAYHGVMRRLRDIAEHNAGIAQVLLQVLRKEHVHGVVGLPLQQAGQGAGPGATQQGGGPPAVGGGQIEQSGGEPAGRAGQGNSSSVKQGGGAQQQVQVEQQLQQVTQLVSKGEDAAPSNDSDGHSGASNLAPRDVRHKNNAKLPAFDFKQALGGVPSDSSSSTTTKTTTRQQAPPPSPPPPPHDSSATLSTTTNSQLVLAQPPTTADATYGAQPRVPLDPQDAVAPRGHTIASLATDIVGTLVDIETLLSLMRDPKSRKGALQILRDGLVKGTFSVTLLTQGLRYHTLLHNTAAACTSPSEYESGSVGGGARTVAATQAASASVSASGVSTGGAGDGATLGAGTEGVPESSSEMAVGSVGGDKVEGMLELVDDLLSGEPGEEEKRAATGVLCALLQEYSNTAHGGLYNMVLDSVTQQIVEGHGLGRALYDDSGPDVEPKLNGDLYLDVMMQVVGMQPQWAGLVSKKLTAALQAVAYEEQIQKSKVDQVEQENKTLQRESNRQREKADADKGDLQQQVDELSKRLATLQAGELENQQAAQESLRSKGEELQGLQSQCEWLRSELEEERERHRKNVALLENTVRNKTDTIAKLKLQHSREITRMNIQKRHAADKLREVQAFSSRNAENYRRQMAVLRQNSAAASASANAKVAVVKGSKGAAKVAVSGKGYSTWQTPDQNRPRSAIDQLHKQLAERDAHIMQLRSELESQSASQPHQRAQLQEPGPDTTSPYPPPIRVTNDISPASHNGTMPDLQLRSRDGHQAASVAARDSSAASRRTSHGLVHRGSDGGSPTSSNTLPLTHLHVPMQTPVKTSSDGTERVSDVGGVGLVGASGQERENDMLAGGAQVGWPSMTGQGIMDEAGMSASLASHDTPHAMRDQQGRVVPNWNVSGVGTSTLSTDSTITRMHVSPSAQPPLLSQSSPARPHTANATSSEVFATDGAPNSASIHASLTSPSSGLGLLSVNSGISGGGSYYKQNPLSQGLGLAQYLDKTNGARGRERGLGVADGEGLSALGDGAGGGLLEMREQNAYGSHGMENEGQSLVDMLMLMGQEQEGDCRGAQGVGGGVPVMGNGQSGTDDAYQQYMQAANLQSEGVYSKNSNIWNYQ